MITNKAVNYSELFELADPLANRPLRLSEQKPWTTNEEAFRLFYGEWQPTKPVVFKAVRGGQATDILWSTSVTMFCISQKVWIC